ncbi:MAG: hypothetical protein M1608_11030 [Candidatus Omnitrophica bacterium]|nr:hypothetical protein [Candidatus Omnitrophota bacterium]
MKTPRFHSCNVLHLEAEERRLWGFNVSNNSVTAESEVVTPPAEPLPAKQVAKKFYTLWRPKLNVAWLPPDQVFLRVVQLPAGEFSELVSMVELQLEKLSPLPVAQVAWTIELIPSSTALADPKQADPHLPSAPSPAQAAPDAGAGTAVQPARDTPATEMQTVAVIIVARNLVEEFLGRLEGQGYLADRLELPVLHQLLTVKAEGDGVWIYPVTMADKRLCLTAWWQGATLQNLNLLRLASGEGWGEVFAEQLTQIAWAGEMEGWLSVPLRCHLVADAALAASWEQLLTRWTGQPIDVVPALAPRDLAALDAQRATSSQTRANLLPPEFTTRYHQQFMDGLWMRGLGALGVLYLAGLVVYFSALQVVNFKQHMVEAQVTKLHGAYTNAMQLKARLQVMQDQVNLKFAALECYKAAAELLPPELTLTDLTFQQGKTLTLHGDAPADQANKILEYNKALSQVHVAGNNGPLLFSKVLPYNSTTRPGAGGMQIVWSFSCELTQTEIE